MEKPQSREPYRGQQRKLVLAFDVGTMFSCVSFALLDPGRVPAIRAVSRFPGQQSVGGTSKIPSVICYDNSGEVLAVGQEAVGKHPGEVEDDEDDEDSETVQRIVKVEWFKLHLRPQALSAALPLPFNKTPIEVFGDFLRYLYRCTRSFFEESMCSGKETWEAIEASGNIEIILTHPNGWEGPQQAQMREAAVRAGLVTDSSDSRNRIHFVSEGEASLQICINQGCVTWEQLPTGHGVIVIDAGDATIDLSVYKRPSTDRSFVEAAKAACLVQGSVMVSRRAKAWLKDNLQGSKYADEVDAIIAVFDSNAKLTFKNATESSFIRFGSVRDKDPRFDIRSGQKKIPGSAMASFFEPSIRETVKTLQEQRRNAQFPIQTVLLVGGFAASDWVFSELNSSLHSVGVTLARPDGHLKTTVANGAISFYLERFNIPIRVANMSYGVIADTHYQNSMPAHVQRANTRYKNPTGHYYISGLFSEILPKGTTVSETREYRKSFYKRSFSPSELRQVTEYIECYRGERNGPRWLDEESDMFSSACQVQKPVSEPVVMELQTLGGEDGSPCYSITYDVVLTFGLNEFTAQIAWKDLKGNEKRGPAQVVYDDFD